MTDILAVGAHPDDVEISIGGTLLKMKDAGYSIVICHCTDGEPTPYGTREARLAEAREAAKMLGAELEILDMPNRYLFDSVENRKKLAHIIRKYQPRILTCPYDGGAHPDHRAISKIADGARFYAKLTKHDDEGKAWELDPWWTPEQFYYSLGVGVDQVRPSFIVDITDTYRRKMEILSCYKSQFNVDMENLASSDRWGPLIGASYGEAFYSQGIPGLDSLADILQRPMSGTRKFVRSNNPPPKK